MQLNKLTATKENKNNGAHAVYVIKPSTYRPLSAFKT